MPIPAVRSDFVTKYRATIHSPKSALPSTPLSYSSTVCHTQTQNPPLDWLFTPKKAVPSCGGAALDQASSAEVFDRILARLVQLEAHEPQTYLRDDYRISWLTLRHLQINDCVKCSAYVAATYEVLGVHPSKVWARTMESRKAILGPKFTQLRKFPSPSTKSQKAKEGIA